MRRFFEPVEVSSEKDSIEMIDLASAQNLLILEAEIAAKEARCVQLRQKIQEGSDDESLDAEFELELAKCLLLNFECRLEFLKERLRKEREGLCEFECHHFP